MARTVLNSVRSTDSINLNIGKMLIFCEGRTEKIYFDYFAKILNRYKYNDIEVSVSVKSANGDSSKVVKFAEEFLSKGNNASIYLNYAKYLVFDCDAPKGEAIYKVINNAINSNENYKLLISNWLFENWLLMYFEDYEKKITKNEVYRRLSYHLGYEYKKANEGIIRQIITTGNFERAKINAENLRKFYDTNGLEYITSIKKMNPFTNVDTLINDFMIAISLNHNT